MSGMVKVSPRVDILIKHSLAFWQAARPSLPSSLRTPAHIPCFANFLESVKNIELDDFKTLDTFSRYEKATDQCDMMEVFNQHDLMIMLMFLPKGFVMPAHDHPDMLVCSKVLKGRLIFDRFDLKPAEGKANDSASSNQRLVQLAHSGESTLETGNMDLLFPHEKNIHSIEALERAIVLDVLFNNYDQKNRVCTLFNFFGQTRDGLFLATTENE